MNKEKFEELNNVIGAKFLVDSKFTIQVQTPPEMWRPDTNIPKEYIEERLRHDMINSATQEMIKKFEKEIKVENVGGFGERRTLEFFAFPKSAFKLMVEYIISEMPKSAIDRIRNSRPSQNHYTEDDIIEFSKWLAAQWLPIWVKDKFLWEFDVELPLKDIPENYKGYKTEKELFEVFRSTKLNSKQL